MTCALVVALLNLGTTRAFAAEVIPPKPAGYFNDYANVVSKEAALRFNEQLAQFERETSNQVVVAIYPKMQSDSDIADYAQRIFQAWQIGSREKRNGVLFIVFTEDRKMRIHTGYGAEGPLPDATAFDIYERRVKPQFRAGDYEGGLATGINSIFKALQGEYKGTGKTDLENKSTKNSGSFSFVVFVLFILFVIFISRRTRQRGYGYSGGGGPFIGGWGGGGGGWSSGGSDGGGFSGFSGGGGSSGGGGAGGSW